MLESYIVRIYRREGGGRKRLVGTMEGADVRGQQLFHSAEELCALLLNGGGSATVSAVGTASEQREKSVPDREPATAPLGAQP